MKHPCKMELVPPETKGYTTALLAWIVAIHYAAGTEVEAKEAIETLHKTIEKSENWVMQNLRDLIRYDRMRVVGSNLHYISSKEGALKMQETIRRPLSAKEMEEFSHIADLALEDTDCILMIVRTKRDQQVVDLVKQVTDRIYVFDSSFFPIDLREDLSILNAIIPFQMAAAIVAQRIGNDTSRYPYDIENISHSEQYAFRTK
ncbi:hypothetical protein [Dubosiella newyorkensis]|uniref:hypothetical protein n=1 Tax=Dubosiella newyorkensis TaxID=1862672 RepID=UPI0023F27EE2|nr:hypothetical protein [Dubosiella newyorkensis]